MHPLEPLTAAEVQHAVSLLSQFGKVTPTTRFVSVSLKEPQKDIVHDGWSNGLPDREASAVLFDNATNSCFETAVSLTKSALLSWKSVPGVQPTMTIDEQTECEQAVLSSAEFKAALKRHCGTDDTSLVMVDIWSAGCIVAELVMRPSPQRLGLFPGLSYKDQTDKIIQVSARSCGNGLFVGQLRRLCTRAAHCRQMLGAPSEEDLSAVCDSR